MLETLLMEIDPCNLIHDAACQMNEYEEIAKVAMYEHYFHQDMFQALEYALCGISYDIDKLHDVVDEWYEKS